MANNADMFDYVVVGGGTAGSIMVNRLSADGASVCLLEAGPTDRHPFIHIPAGYIKNIYSPRLTWGFKSKPEPATANRSFPLPQGRVLGGSSSINGLNYVRGQPADYDNWAQLGNAGWSYDEVLPYFKRSERRIGPGDDAVRGRNGELPITDLDLIHPVCEAFIEGAAQMGIPRNPDYNSGDQAGTGYFQRTVHKGYRYSAAKAFLRPARKRPNVDIRTDAQAAEILFDGTRASGVRYHQSKQDSATINVNARCEVVLCAGALNTPKLLQLSGIGPAEVLGDLGIKVRAELRGVGNNLRDHYGVRMVSTLKDVKTFNSMAEGLPLGLEIAKWLLGRPSVLSVSPSLTHLFWKSSDALETPDLEYVMTPASFREGTVGLLDKMPGMTVGVWQMRPESHGYVRPVSRNPFDPPEINPNYLSDPRDQRVLLRSIRLGRKLMTTTPLQPWLTGKTNPDQCLQSDDELLDWARREGITVYHMIGTARMGPDGDPGAVVDSQLRVRGLQGLRVADASVMPVMPSGNTNAPVMMVAEKAADMILGKILTPADL
ncbi:GMC family oxidoreductase [Ruegeria sp. HKCCD8929]|uniref:GMC family oxidoreductase n=1 Tax=Ruegeria sp. HKCCD8929 TaxID=2683006 RepID=UPI001488CE76|nr:GMC family oxidoreductase N-terminal domain-containing protein [Ruegeria sp. HKCCD8929]